MEEEGGSFCLASEGRKGLMGINRKKDSGSTYRDISNNQNFSGKKRVLGYQRSSLYSIL